MPASPGKVLDIGARSGVDAAWLAARGHHVVAVESVGRLRQAGAALHPSSAIEWVRDGLPRLGVVTSRGRRFDMILLTAVWMHLDGPERRQSMPVVANLLGPGGRVFMSLRHGPVPAGRRMFDVSAAETLGMAAACGLRPLLNELVPSSQLDNNAAGVEWSRLVFCGAGPPAPSL